MEEDSGDDLDRGKSFSFKGPLLLLCVACFCVFASPAKPHCFAHLFGEIMGEAAVIKADPRHL
jgi:hypothetical protein